jgi:hypothetical protein
MSLSCDVGGTWGQENVKILKAWQIRLLYRKIDLLLNYMELTKSHFPRDDFGRGCLGGGYKSSLLLILSLDGGFPRQQRLTTNARLPNTSKIPETHPTSSH